MTDLSAILSTGISRSRHFSTLSMSETTRVRAIVTIERQQEVICALSNGDISNDLDGRIFEVEYRKVARLKDKVTIVQWETIPSIWNGTVIRVLT